MRISEACKVGDEEEIEEQLNVRGRLVVLKLGALEYRLVMSPDRSLFVPSWIRFFF